MTTNHNLIKHPDVVIWGTMVDLQGEQCSKEFLENLVQKTDGYQEGRFDLHQNHDWMEDKLGYVDNLRLIPNDKKPGEWLLIVDAYIDTSKMTLERVGFSFSQTQLHPLSPEHGDCIIYLPFPHYKDDEYIKSLLATDSNLKIGIWIKKAVDPGQLGLLVPTLVFILQPLWKKVFDEEIWPKIKRGINHIPTLRNKGIVFDLFQRISLEDGSEIDLYFRPIYGEEEECFDQLILKDGISKVESFISTETEDNSGRIRMVKLLYDKSSKGYKISSVEYADGRTRKILQSQV